MLADVLVETRTRLVDELERRVALAESIEVPSAGRRARLAYLVDDLIQELRRGATKTPLAVASTDPAEIQRTERALVLRHLVEEIEQGHVDASASEVALVSDWSEQAERRRLEETLRWRSTLLDDIDVKAAIIAPDARVLYVNENTARWVHAVTSAPRDEILGKTTAELGIRDVAGLNRSLDEVLSLARVRDSVEANVLGRTTEFRFDAAYGPDGQVVAVFVVGNDIHDRKLAQRRLDILAKLSALGGSPGPSEAGQALASVPIPELADWCVVNLVSSGRINGTFVAGRSATGPLTEALRNVMPQFESHPLWRELLTSGFQLLAEVSDDLARRLTTPDQYELFKQLGVRSLMVVPIVSRGQVAGIITLAYTENSMRRYGRDDQAIAEEMALHAAHILENARLVKQLRQSDARFRIALASARTIIYEQDASLRYRFYYNPLSTFSPLGQRQEDAFPRPVAEKLSVIKQRVLDTGERASEEMEIQLGDGDTRWYRQSVEPLRSRSGHIVGVIGAATDITEQHDTQLQLAEALTYRERLMSILGHDLRTPLTAIGLANALLLREQLSPGAREQVLRIRHAADRMKEMIGTLMDFTRIRAGGGMPVSLVPAEMGAIFHAVLDEIAAGSPGATFDLDLQDSLVGVWDPDRIAQVFSNLLNNALTHGTQGAPIQIIARGDAATVTFEIRNQGPPIPAEDLPHIFEPFRRVETTERAAEGLGLGLHIAREIVQAHGGELSVESTPDEGTTFTVRLPRMVAEELHEPVDAAVLH